MQKNSHDCGAFVCFVSRSIQNFSASSSARSIGSKIACGRLPMPSYSGIVLQCSHGVLICNCIGNDGWI